MSGKIIAEAPGKVILFGEHAVCFGKRAIATAIDLKTRVEITKREGSGQVSVNLRDLGCRISWPLSDLIKLSSDECTGEEIPILEKLVEENLKNGSENGPMDFSAGYLSSAKESLKSFLYIYLQLARENGHQKYHELLVDISSDIPIGAGLGSSAAYSVAISAALLKIFDENRNPDPDLINKWAFKSEQVFHGKPSGIDNSVSTYGGTLSFKNGQIEKMKNVKLSKLIIVRTKVQRNTKKLVQITIDRREKFTEIMEKIIGAIGNISDQALNSLSKDSLDDLETLIEMNQNLLNSLGVGHSKIDEILSIAKSHCLSGKLTGAGGGGCVIVFPRDLEPPSIEAVLTELKNKGFPAEHINVNCSGVTLC